ncbi:hypothetical protein L218DRAFT_966343 [Marasmius fiardii PR-910]|nr:hypothetical protein L218DRAFT_966343 [Marasmius fiardii PR-910]
MSSFFIPPGIYFIKNLGTGQYITCEASARPGSEVITSDYGAMAGAIRVHRRGLYDNEYSFQSVSNNLFIYAPIHNEPDGAIWSESQVYWAVKSANVTSPDVATPGATT